MNVAISEQAMTQSCRFSIIEAHLMNADKPHTFFQLLKSFLETIRSKDPNIVHYEIARKTLCHLDGDILKNEEAVDMLARELLKACDFLDDRLKLPVGFAKLLSPRQKQPDFPYITITELSHILPEIDCSFFTDEGLSIWDKEYCDLVYNIGKNGIKQSKEILNNLSQAKWDARFWFKQISVDKDGHFFNSSAFLELAAVLWKDIVERRIKLTIH